MVFLTWRSKRQLLPIAVLALIIFGVFFYFGFKIIPQSTCFDNKKNQGEEEIDCGGPCKPCLENLSDPVVLWTRFFQLADGNYEIAALVENAHNFAGAQRLFYRAKIYDQNNVLIAVRDGETFVNPKERFLILEPGLLVGQKKPARALVEFDPIKWKYTEYSPPNIIVIDRNFSLDPQPYLTVSLKNNDLFPLKNLQAAAILKDAGGQAIGASATFIEEISGESEKIIVFSWPKSFQTSPDTIDILIRQKSDNGN
jgi:hypothetical protein